MKRALSHVFPKTIPIMTGFLFLGFSLGMLAVSKGFPPYLPVLMALFIFAGSMEFVTLQLLLAAFNPLQALLLTLMVNARHLFYGLAMLDKYHHLGWQQPYLIFGMCDESFSINVTLDLPQDLDRGWAYFHVTLLNQLYWVCATALGAFIGPYLPINVKGMDFVLNALFIVLLIEQWRSHRQHSAAFIGLGSSALCLVLFGPENFMIPAMILMLVLFGYRYWQQKQQPDQEVSA